MKNYGNENFDFCLKLLKFLGGGIQFGVRKTMAVIHVSPFIFKKPGSGVYGRHLDNIIVNNLGTVKVLKMILAYKCSERNRTRENFCCHQKVVTMATKATLCLILLIDLL